MSLARALSKMGILSRAQAERAIADGRVRVDGTVRREPSFRVDMRRARITLDDDAVEPARRVHFALNKPRGLVTTRDDPQGRETIYACLEGADLPFVAPVGRLDKASEGLLLLTNDTQWAQRVLDPATHLEKTYHVQVDRLPDDALLAALRAGVDDAGEHLAVVRASVLRTGAKHAWLEIVLDEGRNRHIRRLLAAFDVAVLRLVRVAIGPLPLGDLPKGAWRELTPAEVQSLAPPGRSAGGEKHRGKV